VRARREPAGVRISWIRRARRDGDAWEPVEIPVGEDTERYELDILEGGTVLRTLPVSAPEALYAAALELADFGAQQSALSVRVAQLGTTIGRGFERAATVPIA
jgi:hypothetical protein